MRLLITGATGFIGRALVQQLVASGAELYGLALEEDINHSSASSITGSTALIRLIPVDLRNANATAQAVARIKPEQVIHLAAAGVVNPAIDCVAALEHNTQGTLNLLNACFHNPSLESTPRKLIVIRTPGESKPSNAYAASKAATWTFCQMFTRRYGWPIVGAMVFQAYGPGQPAHTFIQAVLRTALDGQDFAMTSGNQSRDWIFLSDVVDGLVATLDAQLSPGDSLDLGTGRRTSLLDVATLAYRLVGRGGAPIPGALADRVGEEDGQNADAARTNETLDWTPQVTLEQGLNLVLLSLAS